MAKAMTAQVQASSRDLVTEDEFISMYQRLVLEQDRSYPAGTFPFMAPEQLLQSDVNVFSETTDLYALGVTLFFLYTNRLPMELPRSSCSRGLSFRKTLEAWRSLHQQSLHQPLPRVSSGLEEEEVGGRREFNQRS
jgi:serine/threonine protein kinase